MGKNNKGKRATKAELGITIKKYRKRAFGERSLVVLSNQAYMIPGTYQLGKVQIYDVTTKQLLMKASSNHEAIKMLEEGYVFGKSPTNGLFKGAHKRKMNLRNQRQRNIDIQESVLKIIGKGKK